MFQRHLAALPLTGERIRFPVRLIATLLAAGIASGCAGTEPNIAEPAPALSAGEVMVSVIDRGWHTDIALPADSISGPVAGLTHDFPGVCFLVFGFGDRAYFMAHNTTLPGTLTALFPGPGVILVTALRAPPAQAFGAGHVVALRLSAAQMRALTAYIQRSLAVRPDGSPQRLEDGPYPGSAFYVSNETYDAFHNCNDWTLGALRRAGLPTAPDNAIFAGQVMTQARRIAGWQRVYPP